jgi:hypothetical protein
MFSKLKAIIQKKYDNVVEQEVADRVTKALHKREIENINYIEQHTKEKYKIVPAFEVDGVQYFKFDDPFVLALGRGMTANEFFSEFSMRCSREYLQAYCAAVNNCLNNSKQIELTKIAKLTTQMEERLNLIFDVDLLYKLASVVYFDKSESPYEYDFKYNLEKINTWKKKDLTKFFLLQPMREFFPSMDLSEVDLDTYTRISQKMTKKNLKDISTMLSEKDKSKDFYKTIASLMNTVTSTES